LSEMPVPRSRLAIDHEAHDALLVAQFSAGDPLDDARRQEAAQLVTECHECALLAGDLRAISRAVARETVPPRRRDFRFDAATAQRSRGSRFSRLLRRLSMPERRALGPVAAGVMSVGLLFVVAGNVWPEEAQVTSVTEPSALPVPSLAVGTSGAGSADETEAAGAVEVTESGVAAEGEEVAGQAIGLDEADAGVEKAQADAADEAVANEEQVLPVEQDEAADGAAAQERRSEALAEEPEALFAAPDVAKEAMRDEFATDHLDALDEERETAADDDTSRVDLAARSGLDEPAPTLGAMSAPVASPVINGSADDARAAVPAADREPVIESALLVIGAALVLVGALLLLLVWLGRRSADPLLR